MPRIKIPTVYYRGGTSKNTLSKRTDLPATVQEVDETCDKILLRVLGSPNPHDKQTDGLGNVSSSTSKTMILDRSEHADYDINYLLGQVSIGKPFVDWSGNYGSLAVAVGVFTIEQGLVDKSKIPPDGLCTIKVRQENISKAIITHIPIQNGAVLEAGDSELGSVTSPATEVQIEFLDPVDGEDSMFPTGNLVDEIDVPNIGRLEATLINVDIPTIFLNATDSGYTNRELQDDINSDTTVLEKFEITCACDAPKMGSISDVSKVVIRAHTPKVAFAAPAADYAVSGGKTVQTTDIDLLVCVLSMGKLHHAIADTASVAITTAAAIPNTLVNPAAGGGVCKEVRFGHPSGILYVGVAAGCQDGQQTATKVVISRSARVIMEGQV